ncbi:hypothetical protein EVAR_40954_1 [Eumeta japonica]|uniref:Uncharacterized protein n=1 Tax=Eumeta variegata TaxID=151549 RepID=A0A4C1X7R5_EUMVA|nr:hypothetical protein EVAR_40954_1 [Eumeta japonica]
MNRNLDRDCYRNQKRGRGHVSRGEVRGERARRQHRKNEHCETAAGASAVYTPNERRRRGRRAAGGRGACGGRDICALVVTAASKVTSCAATAQWPEQSQPLLQPCLYFRRGHKSMPRFRAASLHMLSLALGGAAAKEIKGATRRGTVEINGEFSRNRLEKDENLLP